MGRTNKQWFKHISVHIRIQQELKELKKDVRIHTRATHPISYADVVIFLIKKYKESLRPEYPLEEKLFVVNNLEEKLFVVNNLEENNSSVYPHRKPRPYSESVKLDGKTRVSFLLES